MARPLWKGTLGFGLVSIPVELHTAVRDVGPHFHFLRRTDRSPIGYQKIAKADGQVVSKEELVKGYEYARGRYVILTEEDFDRAAVKRNSRIDLLDFVDGGEVDDRYFNKPYYVLPGTGGDHAYALLREALREANRVGIGKFVMRARPYLVALEVIADALVLSTLRFREELVSSREYQFPQIDLRKPELQMARQLVDALVSTWDPEKYTNEYRANIMAIVRARQARQKPALDRQEPEADSNVIDLMERLRKSLESRRRRPAKAPASAVRKRAAKRGRRRAA